MKSKPILKGLRTNFSQKLLKFAGGFLLLVMGISFLLTVSAVLKDHIFKYKLSRGAYFHNQLEEGLLPSGFDESSCASRYDSLLHQRESLKKPSAYLKSKLRSYEARHQRCAPYTLLYNTTLATLETKGSSVRSECNYIIWFAVLGLGNRMISLASAFLYALLSDRVLLIHPEAITPDLFCEPFPGGSWWLPSDFPLLDKFKNFTKYSNDSFGELLRQSSSGNSSTSPLRQPYVYVHVNQDCGDHDKRFYCEEGQLFIQDVPWLIMMSNQYFAPPFFSMPRFVQELQNLFPDKETVFHLLGRYLFHPTNAVWGLVRRFYDGYLAEADLKVGVQIRIYHYDKISFPFVADQVLSCTMNEGILSRVYPQQRENLTETVTSTTKKKKIVVLMTSLNRQPFEQVRKLYLENATVTGDTITIHQPSFEEHQNTGELNHDKKALAEMYLLSLTDKLLTSEKSTFGYVAQGLGALKPWVIFMWKNETGHGRECSRAVSMEPCMHIPPRFDCKTRQTIGKNVNKPFIRDCQDWNGGIQLVGNYNNTS